MDHKTTLARHINASPDKVWAVVSDIPGSAATLTGLDAVQMISEGGYGEGTRWKETRTMMGRSETVEMWVSQAEPPSASRAGTTTVKARQGGADYTTRFILAERDGGTDLTLTFSAGMVKPTLPRKVMMTLLGRFGMSVTRKALARDVADIAAKAESL